MNVDPIPLLQRQNRPIGAVVGEVGVGRVFGRSNYDLLVLVEEQEA